MSSAFRWTFYLWAFLNVALLNGAVVVVTVGNNGNSFSPSNFTINPGDTVRWIWRAGYHNTSGVSSPAGATSWYANITATDTTFSYIPPISGLYTYTCTHHSGMDGQFFVTGCSFPSKPVISATAGGTGCAGDSIKLSIPLQSGVTYQWIKDGTAIPGASISTLYATLSGAYKVLVNRCGADSISNPYQVTIHPLPVVSFTISNSGAAYTFINSSPNAGRQHYLWTFSDGSSAQTTVNVQHTFFNSGSHWVTLKATDTLTGCSDTATKRVEVSLGLDNLKEGGEALVYPNPVRTGGTIAVMRSMGSTATMYVYSAMGQLVLTSTLTGAVPTVFLKDFKPGIYTCRILNGNGHPLRAKFIVY